MNGYPQYTKKTQIIIGIVVSLIVLGWAFSGFIWFKQSDDWAEVERLLKASPTITNQVGPVHNTSLSFFNFSYKFSGDWATTTFKVAVDGEKSQQHFKVHAERKKGVWVLLDISNL